MTAKTGPKFWAGGHQWGEVRKKDEFIAGNYWQHGYDPDAEDHTSQSTWEKFRQVGIGDWFAIKGYGGKNDLVVYYIGQVVAKDEDDARLELRRRDDIPLFRGKAPAGPRWFDSLVPCDHPAVIDAIFPGLRVAAASLPTSPPMAKPIPVAHTNTIFYGPPGTGKTFEARRLMAAYRDTEATSQQPTSVAVPDLSELKDYQLVAWTLHTIGRKVTVPELMQHPFIVDRFAGSTTPFALNRRLWRILQERAILESKTVGSTVRRAPYIFDKDRDSRWFLPRGLPDDLDELLSGRLAKDVGAPAPRENSLFVTFHQSYSYDDFIEGIRPQLRNDSDDDAPGLSYSLVEGVFKQAVRRAIALTGFTETIAKFCELPVEARRQHLSGAARFALFIDEINRANVSRVFGELITLIEADKRLGAPNEVIVTLPVSGQKFGVPTNLDIIATMNSADRSVEALDTALRRRFAFVEVRPNPDLLDFNFHGNISASKLLKAINDRLARLYDRDHQIGHAYFIDCKANPNLDSLKRVFRLQILPLLQEYFFGAWSKIGLILGDRWVKRHPGSQTRFAKFSHDDTDYDDRTLFEIKDPATATAEDFRAIYEP